MVWQYLLPIPEHGKPAGWHPYTAKACEKLSLLQLKAVQNNSKRTVYHVKSGYYSYEVNVMSLTQRNLTTGKLRQIRQHSEISTEPPSKKKKSATLALDSLFGGGCAHVWEPILAPFISNLPAPELFIGRDRNPAIIPVRELTFQAIKPLPPVEWRVIIFGQNPVRSSSCAA
ncbi:DNA glycosylase [Gracilaria domingensis]|nr:DNA glycosylase [Gracilaria domingensis]